MSELNTCFTLTKVDIINIDEQYQLKAISELVLNCTPLNVTKISELRDEKTRLVTFTDGFKKSHKCRVSMIDFTTKKPVDSLHYHCFWDRFPIQEGTIQIGCPISYIPNTTPQIYKSSISKDTYTIREIISKSNINIDNSYISQIL